MEYFSALRSNGVRAECSVQYQSNFIGWYTMESQFLSDGLVYENSGFKGELFMLQARVDMTIEK